MEQDGRNGRVNADGVFIPDPGPRCEACRRPLLGNDAVPLTTRIVVSEENFDNQGKPMKVQIAEEGTALVCPDCAPLLAKAAG